jgi:glycerophosphoryl diester phosphodiesterase
MNFLELFEQKNLIAAHRGARAIRPENTLSALQASVGHCDFIEVDVQLSREGIALIMHDDTLERTTNIKEFPFFASRISAHVCEFSYEELLVLDYGSWFYKADPFHQIKEKKVNLKEIKTTREPLLTLDETLKFVQENQLFINVEIKDIHLFFSDEEAVQKIAHAIQAWHVESLVLLSSFRHEYLPLCKKLLPDVATAALVENQHPHAKLSALIAYLKNLHVDAYNLDEALVDARTVHALREAGFFVNVYTVNDPNRQKELFEMGVNGVFSDFV